MATKKSLHLQQWKEKRPNLYFYVKQLLENKGQNSHLNILQMQLLYFDLMKMSHLILENLRFYESPLIQLPSDSFPLHLCEYKLQHH